MVCFSAGLFIRAEELGSLMTLTLQHLAEQLDLAPPAEHLIVAFSGGIDSAVLLHCLQQLRDAGQLNTKLSALHINHGLQDKASQWQTFCEDFCAMRNLPLICKRVEVAEGGSQENAARESRYEAFIETLQAGDLLLLAHHLDDQLETFMLRLQRGAGIAGLTGIPQQRKLGAAWLYRPLLSHSRQELESYAQAAGIKWVEDGSNSNNQFDRNFLRHDVLPVFESRWPNYRESWQKSLALVGEASAVISELAEMDLSTVTESGGTLSCAGLVQLSTPRLRNVLRHWLKHRGAEEPGWNPLQSITQQSLSSRDEGVLLDMPRYRLHIFAGSLHFVSANWERELPADMTLPLAADAKVPYGNNGILLLQTGIGNGIAKSHGELLVKCRQGGEELQLPGRPTKSLKKLFQENKIPPWLRERTPLLFAENQLICVPGIGIAEGFQAQANEEGVSVLWQPPAL